MKKYIIAGIGILLVVLCALSLSKRTVSRTDYVMNTVVTISATSHSPSDAVDKALDEIRRIDLLMSATNEKSDISKINNAPYGTGVEVSREVFDLISLSQRVSRISDGAFDISVNPLSLLWNIQSENPVVPDDTEIEKVLASVGYEGILLDKEKCTVTLQNEGMSISLGAVAKGYAADLAAKILKENGVKDAIIDLGGNIYVIGKDKRIGIQEPFKKRGEYFRVCTVSDTSVVTSGAYERYFESDGKIYHHILDPKTGRPAQSDIKSATVICKSSALADALSTTLFVAGQDKIQKITDEFGEDIVAILYCNDGKILEYK